VQSLYPLAERVAERLKASKATVAVAESSSGGLVAAALLAVPGASAYFLSGAVIYTKVARSSLLGITPEQMGDIRSASEPYAKLLAETVRAKAGATWGIAETGAAGPTGNGYGDAPGHSCIAISGPGHAVATIETGSADRAANMERFAAGLLELLLQTMGETP